MDDFPFPVDPKTLKTAKTLDIDDLQAVVDNTAPYSNSNSEVEEHAYLAYVLATRSNSTEPLSDVIDLLETWLQGSPENHPDRARRVKLGEFLKGKLSELEEDENEDEEENEEDDEGDESGWESCSNSGSGSGSGSGSDSGSDSSSDSETREFGESDIILSIIILKVENTIKNTKLGDPDYLDLLSVLYKLVEARYDQSKDIHDIDRALWAAETIFDNTPADHPDYLMRLHNIAGLLGEKFDKAKDERALDRAIRITNKVLRKIPTDDELFIQMRLNLCSLLCDRFSATGKAKDLKAAREIFEAAKALGSAKCDSFRQKALEDLVTDLTKMIDAAKTDLADPSYTGFPRTVKLNILYSLLESFDMVPENKVSIKELLDIEIDTDGEVDDDGSISGLGRLLVMRYHRGDESGDIGRAIKLINRAVEIDDFAFSSLGSVLLDLGYALDDNVMDSSSMKYIKKLVDVTEMVLQSIDEDAPGYISYWDDVPPHDHIASWLTTIDVVAPDLETIEFPVSLMDRVIEILRVALPTSDENSPTCISLQVSLALWLVRRFNETGEDGNLSVALEILEKAIYHLSETNYEEWEIAILIRFLFKSIAGQWAMRRQEGGEFVDLAVRVGSLTVDYIDKQPPKPEYDADKAKVLNCLANILLTRASITQRPEDYGDAIKTMQRSIDGLPFDPEGHGSDIISLGLAIFTQVKKPGMQKHVDRWMVLADKLLTDHLDSVPLELSSLIYSYKFEFRGDVSNLDKAIELRNHYLEKDPIVLGHDSHISVGFSHLGQCYGRKYERLKNVKDLDNAIEALEKSIASVVDEPLHQDNVPAATLALGKLLMSRFDRTHQEKDLYHAEAIYRGVWDSACCDMKSRLDIGNALLRCVAKRPPAKINLEEVNDLLKEIVHLLSSVTSRSLRNIDKQQLLADYNGTASLASSVAVMIGKKPADALKVLEQGRGIIAGLALELGVDTEKLEKQDSELATQFKMLRDLLGIPFDGNIEALLNEGALMRESEKRQRKNVEDEFDEVLKNIRTRPGFESFLLPVDETQFMAAAESSKIVVLNMISDQCEVFLVEKHQIRVIVLKPVYSSEVEEKVEALKGSDESEVWGALEWLWNIFASPILEALDIKGPPVDGIWPRICWIPTGDLNRLPLHAAGKHLDGNETVMDRVISSYSLSIKALIYGRQSGSATKSSQNALLIAMPKTMEHFDLPFAQQEVDILKNLCSSMQLTTVIPQQNQRNEVLKHITDCKIFHFAGHGSLDRSDPSQSFLMLDDWKSAPLTVEQLWDHKIPENRPFLAFLSACSTGASSDSKLKDESIHLVSAFQLSGFRHVIGTLWEVNDEVCVEVARIFYETLRDEGTTDEIVSLGLHRALLELRLKGVESTGVRAAEIKRRTSVRGDDITEESGVRGERDARNAKRVQLDQVNFSWIPYIHYGV
ncbi:hypothetical protein H072_9061 [Dactylellina haptotyla CBS 200.50]|uniref:CHAT domain-containing protein n=1 Tax=Dactylellina haptotyla (strain CBS 200.50) TaxID=1284197 RepID=S8A2L2_DACHA|nr:hypothetical protein H072_9061 [Dactylellina haptotyla CBS 200.50]